MAINIKIYNKNAESVKESVFAETVFGVKVNEGLVHQAMVAQLSNERQVLAHTKTKSEVRGGGKKPWKQKGTGRARAGSSRSPIWIGGGVTFGPRNNRNFDKKINLKMKRKALNMVLSDKIVNNRMAVIDDLSVGDFKTKAFLKVLETFEKEIYKTEDAKKYKKIKRSLLIINSKENDKTYVSARNIEGVKVINSENINILDLLLYKNVMTEEATLKGLEKINLKTVKN